MTNPIVQINVSLQVAPAPSSYQQTGAFVTQGGTTLSAPAYSLLTELSDLYPILAGREANSSLVWSAASGGTVTVTTASAHGQTGTVTIRIFGVTPSGYNGTFSCTVTGSSTFTYSLFPNPGLETVPGYWFLPGTQSAANELVEMATTFFAQGSSQSVYVLDLGTGSVSAGVTALTTFIASTPGIFYAYLMPREWDGVSQYLSFLANFNNPTSQTYFFTTTTTGTYTDYTALMKCVVAMVEAPVIGTNEFSLAAVFWNWLHQAPSGTNRLTSFAWIYLFGVTPYPTAGNSVILTQLQNANVNVVGTGSQGGISNTILVRGTTMDGRNAMYWYSIDWIQIQLVLNVANAIIDGSNNPLAPLYYDQQGINTLQQVAVNTVENAITFGCATGTVTQTSLDPITFTTNFENGTYPDQNVVNAVPFVTYAQENPSDFPIGRYAGFGVVYLVNNGFTQVIFNLVATQFAGTQ